MKKIIVVNHPQHNPSDLNKIEKVIGDECCIMNVSVSNLCIKKLLQLTNNTDMLLFFSAMVPILKVIVKDKSICKKIHILRGNKDKLGEYRLCKFNI